MLVAGQKDMQQLDQYTMEKNWTSRCCLNGKCRSESGGGDHELPSF